MKTLTRMMLASMLASLVVPTSTSQASPVLSTARAHLGILAIGQDKEVQAENPREEVASLLARARAAMSEGDFKAADSCIEQAESLNVKFPFLYQGDTPKKARRDLEKQTQENGPSSASGKSKKDPFAERDRASGISESAPPAAEDAKLPMPKKSGRELTAAPDGKNRDADAPPPADVKDSASTLSFDAKRTRSSEYLTTARKAIAVGDVREAARHVEQAKSLKLRYRLNEDSPEKVEAIIDRWMSLQKRDETEKQSESYRKEMAVWQMELAESFVTMKDYEEATRLAEQADRMNVTYAPLEMNPKKLLSRIADAKREASSLVESLPPVEDDLNVESTGTSPMIDDLSHVDANDTARTAEYDRDRDTTREIPASGNEADPATTEMTEGMRLFMDGEAAMAKRDYEAAMHAFREAGQHANELDPVTYQKLQDRLQLLARPQLTSGERRDGELMDAASERAKLLARQVSADLARKEIEARRLQEHDPKGALELLKGARSSMENAGLDSASRDILTRRVDRAIVDLERYIETNRPRIELDEQNRAVEDEIRRDEQSNLEGQQKLAQMVNEYNQLMDEERFAEAEVIAKRAGEMDPDNPIVKQLKLQSAFVRRLNNAKDTQDQKERSFADALDSVEESSIAFDDRNPISFGDATKWKDITKSRTRLMQEHRRRRTEKDILIEQKLKTPIMLHYQDAPLSEVLNTISKEAQINVYLDPRGLAEEGVSTDTAVSIELPQEVSLKSALNLILKPLHLGYVIKDEVLRITSENDKDDEVYAETYYVADLVMPIPNFVPTSQMGLSGAIAEAHDNMRTGWGRGASQPATAVLASANGGSGSAVIDPNVMAQLAPGTSAAAGASQGKGPSPGGPGGLGGGVQPDFDSLIELITTTVAPTSWDETGGPGSIKEFEGNLSLVISQTQEIHEQIADLLEQLRRLQDLQVTIEVRFITLNDNFFERIGIDFDFDINDNSDRPFQLFGGQNPNAGRTFGNTTPNLDVARNFVDRDLRQSQSVTVGVGRGGLFTGDLDIPFRNGSFPLAVPQFGNFQPGAGAELGFAILSDLETYFFIEASQGDRRSNVLQAPKVTLFNGQTAFVTDASFSPFVISVIPVVGDFAAALQPVIVVLAEGTMLTVQATVSPDRRFVRLTVVPMFSRIEEVNTFTFSGSSSTTEDTSSAGPADGTTERANNRTTTQEGTTVQLPTLAIVSVTTTVSVPDGGTVLLGGVKRLAEGRNEFGVPLLSKLPYVNRLFRNVGIGRETQSLMMMVTPRIIIQEEEEAYILGGNVAP